METCLPGEVNGERTKAWGALRVGENSRKCEREERAWGILHRLDGGTPELRMQALLVTPERGLDGNGPPGPGQGEGNSP